MRQRRAYRWGLFFIAVVCFLYVLFVNNHSLWALILFFVSGGGWWALERSKMRELDALRAPKES